MATLESGMPHAGHRRNKSSSVLKSIIVSRSHKRAPSNGTSLVNDQQIHQPYMSGVDCQTPILPPDHPHGHIGSVGRAEDFDSRTNAPPGIKSSQSSPKKSLRPRPLSTVSLREMARKEEMSKEAPVTDIKQAHQEGSQAIKPKKIKSSANLATIFGKGKTRGNKQLPTEEPRDKENTTPPSTSNASAPPRTPIWAEFSSQSQITTTTSQVPLNDGPRGHEGIAVYTPHDYSLSKQRDYFDQPTFQEHSPMKDRPKSMLLPKSGSSATLLESFTLKKSGGRVPLADTKGNEGRLKADSPTKRSQSRPILTRAGTEVSHSDLQITTEQPSASTKKSSRVMAAVAAFNGKSKKDDAMPSSPTKMDLETIDAEFEMVLESRNIPTHQRAQMRTLKMEVKADFVRMHKLDTSQASRATSSHSPIGATTRPALARSSKSRDGCVEEDLVAQQTKSDTTTKRGRPRSKAFTFGRSDSPTKKQKGNLVERKTSSKVNPIPKSPSTRSLVSNASERSVSAGSKAVKSDEFIAYLRKTPKPQQIEVGKLHKLRLLLRNETVEWVDTFIQDGGMVELVGLFHRITEIEWREDHEDSLLHELLRCLKGLCTTATALKQLKEISTTLYPALLAMLFDEEHKGPSEFTTRELIIEIIFAHISTAPEAELEARATQLLKYLRDPIKEKESSTVPFILQMHQSRPYQVWCKEMTNVTKEVFWIFIHHLNVVPIPPAPALDTPPKSYAKQHFPGQRAIVPAAPYVGGVEWDATNYLATHIDLINGLLASFPTRSARNTLRAEFRISGFERLLGHLRTCNPKYYGAVHDSLKVWIDAALEDDWEVKPVRMGGSDKGVSPVKNGGSPAKKKEKAPQLQAPKMDVELGLELRFEGEVAIGELAKDDDWM